MLEQKEQKEEEEEEEEDAQRAAEAEAAEEEEQEAGAEVELLGGPVLELDASAAKDIMSGAFLWQWSTHVSSRRLLQRCCAAAAATLPLGCRAAARGLAELPCNVTKHQLLCMT